MRSRTMPDSPYPDHNHERFVSHLLHQPDSMDVILDATSAIEGHLRGQGWPENVGIIGLTMQALWNVYAAGERRGAAREHCPVAALYPVAELATK